MNNEGDTECPICAKTFVGKIFQCKEGHAVCESCLRKIQEHACKANCKPKCPSCAGPLDDDAVCRNRALESMLENQTIDCSNASNGCPIRMKRAEVKDHEAVCSYSEIRNFCRLLWSGADCSFHLSASTATTTLQHFRSSHPNITYFEGRHLINWSFEQIWKGAVATGTPHVHTVILQAASQNPIAVVFKFSKYSVSVHSVDLCLNASAADNPTLWFSVPSETTPRLNWSFPVARGKETWRFFRDQDCPTPIEIGIRSLLQHCDDQGKLKMLVEIK